MAARGLLRADSGIAARTTGVLDRLACDAEQLADKRDAGDL
jgi:hypothetical protein